MTNKRDHTATVQSVLQGQGLNVPDAQIYAGELNDGMEDTCIAIAETGGLGAGEQLDRSKAIQRPTVQVMVRNTDKTQCKSDADDVWRILHDNTPSGYSPADMLQSSPIKAGKDNDGRHMYSVNVRLFIYE